uniref:Putative aminotransferase n=1 Tax=viral metagenome TaxID=1070528 RepID=A0A6M3IFE7_9ZZZZ
MLLEWTGFEDVAMFSTGSEATEAAWRACMVYSGKPGVWGGMPDPDNIGQEQAGYDAMHGNTLGAMIMAGRLSWGSHIFASLVAGAFAAEHGSTGMMIMEPYHGPSAQFYPDSLMTKLRANVKEFTEIPLCFDEVQAGFGRTGRKFGYQWYDGMTPTLITTGKAMGGGYPLSALFGPKDFIQQPDAVLHSTHSGHPVMCSVGIAVLEQIQKHDLVEQSFRKGMLLADLLKDCGVRHHAGKGLIAGLEFKDDKQAAKVVKLCRERGLLVVDTGRKWVKLGPPLIIDDDLLGEGVEIIKRAIGQVIVEGAEVRE